jgi:hypothetical protein
MSLLDDFKTQTGASEADQFLVNYYLKPALNKASEVTNNKKRVTVNLTSGVNSYDLTDGDVASPVITTGIQEIAFDRGYFCSYIYKDEFYLSNPQTLYFVNPESLVSQIEFNYYSYYSIPTLTPTYTETDLPNELWPAVLLYATALYGKDKVTSPANGGSVQQIQEYNLSKSFGTQTTRLDAYESRIKEAIKEMKTVGGWAQRALIYSIQIV